MDLITIDRLDGWNKSKVNEEEEDFLFRWVPVWAWAIIFFLILSIFLRLLINQYDQEEYLKKYPSKPQVFFIYFQDFFKEKDNWRNAFHYYQI